MQRNSKQVLLKYNTVERKTTEDALMFKIKTSLRWFFLTALLFFPFMFYVPLYFDDGTHRKSMVEVGVYGWGLNTNRSIPLYVIPDNDTALIIGNNLCSKPLLLLIVVFSAVKNTLERETIRETWGKFSCDCKIAFLLGTTDNVTLQEEIEEEASIHNDVIQENFVDSYNNLTIKAVMMLKFVKNHCGNVEYVFKSDDDMFTYVPNLTALIKVIRDKKVQNVLIGKLICGAKPIRQANHKWEIYSALNLRAFLGGHLVRVSVFHPSQDQKWRSTAQNILTARPKKRYAARYMYEEKVYPNYLSGTGYLMDRATALQLYDAALEIPYLHLEDIFITGLCARKAKIRPRHHSGFTYITRPLDPCIYIQNQNVITSHKVAAEQMKQLWTSLNNGTACPKSKMVVPARFNLIQASVGKKNRCV